MFITSDRKFGVEIEFIADNHRGFSHIRQQINVVHDGSLRPHEHAGEYVSEVLSGRKGEQRIHHVCDVLKKNGASCEENCTSVHVHLDGKRDDYKVTKYEEKPTDTGGINVAISKAVLRKFGVDLVETMAKNQIYAFPGVYISTYDGIQYYSMAPLDKEPGKNYVYFTIETNDRFRWLRNVFYFYTLYSPVMESIVSNSRKNGNMFCIPLARSYDPEDIYKSSNMTDLYNIWYKGREHGGHYDNSRYHNVNFHSFFSQPGTVEIRSHGGTTDANKIILWIKLHQQILDKLEDIDIKDIKDITDTGTLETLCASFLSFIEEPLLQEYVKRLLGYYSNISIK